MVALARQDDPDDTESMYQRYLGGPVDQTDEVFSDQDDSSDIIRWGLPDHDDTIRDVLERASETKDSEDSDVPGLDADPDHPF